MSKSKRPAYSQFLTYLGIERSLAADELEAIQINTRTWAHNLEWNGERMMRLAVICEAADHYEEILTDTKNTDLPNGFRACKAMLQRDLMHEARYPKASTSPMANLMWAVRNSVRAEFLQKACQLEDAENE